MRVIGANVRFESSFSFIEGTVREKLIAVLTFIELSHKIMRRSAVLYDPRFARTRTEFEQ